MSPCGSRRCDEKIREPVIMQLDGASLGTTLGYLENRIQTINLR